MTESTAQPASAAPVTRAFDVVGMTCEHCVRAVTEEVSAVPGVSAVSIELVPEGRSRLRVTSDHPVDAAAVTAAVDEAGYAVVGGLEIGGLGGRA